MGDGKFQGDAAPRDDGPASAPKSRSTPSADAATRAASIQIAGATGATFSLLPPDNSTGNFVKVVQRVPVKIVLDAATDASAVLRPGMSVNATVYLR